MLSSFIKTNRGRGGRRCQNKFLNMSTTADRLRPVQKRLRDFFGIDRRVEKLRKRPWTYSAVFTSGIAMLTMIDRGSRKLSKYLESDDEGGGNRYAVYFKEKKKDIERRYMIKNGVGQGLAWLHYAEYLQIVLPDLKNSIEKSEWYKKLPEEDKKRIPMKIYEVIPRKCYIDVTGTDENIQHAKSILVPVDNEKNIEIKIYSIMDGQTRYYCMCNCPNELKTMNHVNDIQEAGISHSKFTNYNFLWTKDSTVQLFDVDTKLVQLMRFYYTLSSLLCRNKEGFMEKARIILFNESQKKLSNVLLQAIKEDLNVDSSETLYKKDSSLTFNGLLLSMKLLAAEYKDGHIDFNVLISNPEALLNKDALVSDNTPSNGIPIPKKKDSKVDSLSQKTYRSLMENDLMSAEETMDIFYEFDVFVTRRKEEEDTNTDKNMKEVNKALLAKKMKVLLEKDCIGKDWLTKLKYAATKCRWIVFVDTDECSEKLSLPDKMADSLKRIIIESRQLFVSQTVADSLKNILTSRNVQTVALVNPENEMRMTDGLRWVKCIPFKKDTDFINTVYKVVSGFEIKQKKSEELYFGPGEVAVGLAWHYAAFHLNKKLPIVDVEVRTDSNNQTKPLAENLKLIIVVPKSCEIKKYLSDAPPTSDQQRVSQTGNKIPGNIVVYNASTPNKEPVPFVGEYARPVGVIHKMKMDGILNENQMRSEVEKFYTTVDKIMKILLPEKKDDYHFVYYDDLDKDKTLDDFILEIFQEEQIRIKMCTDNSPF